MSATSLAKTLLPLPVFARAAYLRQYWLAGEWELRELGRIIPAPGLAIDVGANVGSYSYALRRLGHQVIAFEPDRNYEKRLRALMGERARIEAVALSNNPGTGKMRVPILTDSYGGALGSLSDRAVPDDIVSTSYEVELRTLDSYGFDNVTFLKVDVEGHEEAVLAGASNTLQRSKPVILIEIEERHNPGGLKRITESLARHGYSGSFYYERNRYSLADFIPEYHQVADCAANEGSNRRKLKYVNNFVFSVAERYS